MATRRLKPAMTLIGGLTARDLLDALAESLANTLLTLVRRTVGRVAYLGGDVSGATLSLDRPLQQALVSAALTNAASGVARGVAEVALLQAFHAPEEPRLRTDIQAEAVLPEEALRWLERRSLTLAGSFSDDVLGRVNELLTTNLKGQSTPLELQRGIQDVLGVSESRARLIAVTETTSAFNIGRLVDFNLAGVDYVRYSAVLDSRTSPICRSRNGLILAIDDPRLPDLSPPAHGHCRSIWSPIYGRLEPELIENADLTDWTDALPSPKGWDSRVFTLPSGLI